MNALRAARQPRGARTHADLERVCDHVVILLDSHVRLAWYELAVFLGLSMVLAGFSFWWIRRPVA